MTGGKRAAKWAKRIVPFWIAAVVIGSFLPGPVKLYLRTKPYVPHHPIAWQHRLAHLLTFGVTALLLMLDAERKSDEARGAGAAFLLGCAIEVGQLAVGYAPVFEWWDVRDDFLAALAVFLAFQAQHVAERTAGVGRWGRRPRSRQPHRSSSESEPE